MSTRRWAITTAVSLLLGAVAGLVVVSVSVGTDKPAGKVTPLTVAPAMPRSLP